MSESERKNPENNPENGHTSPNKNDRPTRDQNQTNKNRNKQRSRRNNPPQGQKRRNSASNRNQSTGNDSKTGNHQHRRNENESNDRRPQNHNGNNDQRKNGQRQNNHNHNQNGERNGARENNQQNVPWGMNPRRTDDGIQTRSQRGEFAKNWWARRWLEALERLMLGVRLTRGQHYARLGQIVSMEEIKGGVSARVQGSRSKPYRVNIQITPMNNRQWEKVFDILAEKAIYAAKLLAGEMPEDIENVFNQAGVSLFPTRSTDLQTSCTCPDKVTPCKHIAATHYILGDRFDEDPFLLFRMRGRSQEQILEALRQRRGAEAEIESMNGESNGWDSEPEQPRFPETLANFWNAGHELNDVHVHIHMPNTPQPLLKRLGEPEVASQLTLQGQLEESYNAISQFTNLIAYADIANGNGTEEE